MSKAVFLDRDGTITFGTPRYERVDSLDKVELLPNTLKALKLLSTMDYEVFIITNQAGLSEGLITKAEFDEINNKVLELVAPTSIKILQTYLCPHTEEDNCDCRKPKPKLILDAAKDHNIDLSDSYMIGDRHSDILAGKNAGTKTILVKTGSISEDFEEATHNSPSLLEAVQYVQNVSY